MKKIIALLLFIGLSRAAFSQSQTPITANGHGEAILIPSSAELWMDVSYKGPEVGELFGRLEAEAGRLRDIFKKVGIPNDDIKDDGNRITENYSEGVNTWERFTLSRKFHLTIRDLKLIDKVLTKAKEEEIDQINGPVFNYSDRGKIEGIALQNAINDAKKNAETQALGKKLGEPQIVSKTIGTNPEPSGAPPGQERLTVDITAQFN